MSGKDGGVTSRPITRLSLCSRITRGRRSRWRVAPHFISSLTAFTQCVAGALARPSGRAQSRFGPEPSLTVGLVPRSCRSNTIIEQYLSTALIDELHLAIAPVLLGDGEHLLGGLNLPALGYECVKRIEGARASHVTLRKRA
jgi:hypothetical protein